MPLSKHFVLLLAFAAASPTFGSKLLVGNKSAANVWRLSLDDGRKLGEFRTGEGPHEIAVSPDGRRIVVSNYGAREPGNTLTVADARTGRALGTVDLGKHRRPHGLRFLPGGERLLTTTEDSDALLLVDVAARKVEAAIDIGAGRGHMVAAMPDGKAAFVTKLETGTVARVDLEKRRKTHEVASGAGAEGVAVRPDGSEVWVTNREAGTVTIHAPGDLALRHTLQSDGFPIRVAFTHDGRHALVTNARAATLAVFDVARRERTATVELARKDAKYRDTLLGRAALPIGVTADPARKRVYVAISGGDEIAVVDTATWKVVGYWKTGREPDALGIVP
jgi:DNA-binding beta-propeller fold protein YncE